MAVAVQRITAEIPRAAEYFSVRELQAQTGRPAAQFAALVLKELVDNALDAAEAAGVVPEIAVEVSDTGGVWRIAVADNGPGIPPEVVRRVLDFSVRVSDKAVYRAPTRGAQGNALKTVVAIPFVLAVEEPVIIESRGARHFIRAWADPGGNVRVDHRQVPGLAIAGTKVVVPLLAREQDFSPAWWAGAFAVFNPHAEIKLRVVSVVGSADSACSIRLPEEAEFLPTVDGRAWRKFVPTDPTSPWWYGEQDFARLVFAYLNAVRQGRAKDTTVREFVRQFRGLTGSARVKAVCDRLAGVSRVSDLEARPDLIPVLLAAMKECARPAPADVLGWCGGKHFRLRFEQLYGVKRYWYERTVVEVAGIPYVLEAALAETEQPGDLFTAVNFSPTFEDPLASTYLRGHEFGAWGIGGFLARARCHPMPTWEWDRQSHVAVAFHLVSPALDFLDRAKTRLKVPEELARGVVATVWSVCKVIYAEEKRRERDAARAERAAREREKELRRRHWTLRDAVFEVLPEAVDRATGGGRYPVSARTLYYQVRPLVQRYTKKDLDYNYFSQQLLVEYQQVRGPIERLYYDPRGYLYEPHSGRALALGTREVEAYDFPRWTFDKILYVEKKGLWPVLAAARLAERYDMAVIVAEGYATEAARVLFRRAREVACRLFVLHDADPHGYNIARTLREETRRLRGYSVDVVDLGLSVAEALRMGLESEEFTRQQDIPHAVKEGLSERELEWFVGRQVGKNSWICKRVELNAMSAPQLIRYVEAKLAEHGAAGKVLPPAGVVAARAAELYRAMAAEIAERRVTEMLDVASLVAQAVEAAGWPPELAGLREWLGRMLSSTRPESWRDLLEAEVRRLAEERMSRVDWDGLICARRVAGTG
jgi:hypothetical protein